MSATTIMKSIHDINTVVTCQNIRTGFIQGDANAHRFEISVVDGKEPVDLSGKTVLCDVLIETPQSPMLVPVPGTISGNLVTVVLPGACYAVPARINIAVRLVDGVDTENRVTILWASAVVVKSKADTIIDPGEVVPDLTELLAQIDRMKQATADAERVAGPVLQTVEDIKAKVVATTPEAYGAVGDGIHDDAPAFAKMFRDTDAKEIHLGSKVYLLSYGLTIPQTITMIGVEGTKIQYTNAAITGMFKNSDRNIVACNFKNIEFEATQSSAWGFVGVVHDFMFENCSFKGFDVVFSANFDTVWQSGIKTRRCSFTDCATVYRAINGERIHNLYFVDTDFKRITSAILKAANSINENVVFERCNIEQTNEIYFYPGGSYQAMPIIFNQCYIENTPIAKGNHQLNGTAVFNTCWLYSSTVPLISDTVWFGNARFMLDKCIITNNTGNPLVNVNDDRTNLRVYVNGFRGDFRNASGIADVKAVLGSSKTIYANIYEDDSGNNTDKGLTNRVDVLEEAADGNIITTQVDDSVAYVKIVPDKTLAAKLCSVGGSTIASDGQSVNYSPDMVVSVGANLFDESTFADESGTVKYLPLYVGNGTFTASSGYSTDETSSSAQEFLLPGNVTSGISSMVNGVFSDRHVTVDAVDGYVTVAYRIYNGMKPSDRYFMLNKGSTAISHKPYHNESYDLSALVAKYFPNGMRSAGDAYDEIDLKRGVAIQRVDGMKETPIDPADLVGLTDINVEAGGTLTFTNDKGDNRIPLPSRVEFKVKQDLAGDVRQIKSDIAALPQGVMPNSTLMMGDDNVLYTRIATSYYVNNRGNNAVITPSTFDVMMKIAMCDGKGAAWTAAEQQAAQQRLGIVTLTQEEYDLLETKGESTIYLIVG